MYYYGDDMDAMIKTERKKSKSSKKSNDMSINEWRFNDYGSAEPRGVSMENIFSAYRDYRASQQWN